LKLFVGSDHAAFHEKQLLVTWLKGLGHQVDDCGTDSTESVDYPVFASAVARAVAKSGERGILLCGSGIGVSMVANRFQSIRAALCQTPRDAELSRQHNDANILCLGARSHSFDELKSITEAWLNTSFEGDRHQRRVDLFNSLGEHA
jgi:ribose 5-phosphate isomerase B